MLKRRHIHQIADLHHEKPVAVALSSKFDPEIIMFGQAHRIGRIPNGNNIESVKSALPMRPGRFNRLAARIEVARLTRSEEHTSELQSLMRISYAVFCLKKKKKKKKRSKSNRHRL